MLMLSLFRFAAAVNSIGAYYLERRGLIGPPTAPH